MDYLGLALSLGNELLRKLPDYPERDASKFLEMQKDYNEEKVKSYPLRDDDLIMNLKEELHLHLEKIRGAASK